MLESRPLVQNAGEQFASFLPGIENLEEKSIPITRIHPGADIPLPGTRNLGERTQIESVMLPGLRNLAEKSIPEAVILRMSGNHPKSEYEHI